MTDVVGVQQKDRLASYRRVSPKIVVMLNKVCVMIIKYRNAMLLQKIVFWNSVL